MRSSTSEESESALDEIQRDVLAGSESTSSITPALDVLARDQRHWLRRWLDEGYDDRRELLFALHQMQVLSLGYVPDGWFVSAASGSVELSVLITDERERRRWRDDPPSLEQATRERRAQAAKFIRPAFRHAQRDLRSDAKQYTEDNEVSAEDIDQQRYFAMRPALDDLYCRQVRALRDLLDGFAGMSAVDEWLSDLDRAALGELAEIEPDFDYKIHSQTPAQRVLLRSEEKYVRERQLWASTYLLPAFNRAVKRWRERADETNEQRSEGMHTPKQL